MRQFSSFDELNPEELSPDYDVAGSSQIGQHTRNEDAYFVAGLRPAMQVRHASPELRLNGAVVGAESAVLMIVADGVGGLPKGDLASRLAVEGAALYTLNHVAHPRPKWSTGSPESSARLTVPGLRQQLSEAIDASDECIRRHSEHIQIGSTITLAYLVWPILYIAHVGDTRAYVLRGGQLHQITQDHTVGQKLAQHELAIASAWHKVLWNCLGGEESLARPDILKFRLEPYDQWLMCSDGLHGVLNQDHIAKIMLSHSTSQAAADALVAAAVQSGSLDDVTVICGRRLTNASIRTKPFDTQPKQRSAG